MSHNVVVYTTEGEESKALATAELMIPDPSPSEARIVLEDESNNIAGLCPKVDGAGDNNITGGSRSDQADL